MTRRLALALPLLAFLAGCGGSSQPTIGPAATFSLAGFQPAKPAVAGKPTVVSFTIKQPNGKAMTAFKTGSGPHTGVHLIVVRRDLATMIHTHPKIGPDGKITQAMTFTEPGPYKVVVDVYPKSGPQPNFQLFSALRVAGDYKPKPLSGESSVVVDGYRFTLKGKPSLRAIQAGALDITVTDPNGKPAKFTPWYGALAHAIFFRKGTLDYFHTHVCGQGTTGCTSVLGSTAVTGSSTKPGLLKVGVLVPVAGTWRLFVQAKVDGHILTAPFVLAVKP
jgi:hypothetical protein